MIMKTRTLILIASVLFYGTVISLTIYGGGLWLFLTLLAVLGVGYDIHSYIRLRKGKAIITYHTVKSLLKK